MSVQKNCYFLPLITTRDILIVFEVLNFGHKFPDTIIYKNQHRKVDALRFRREILFQFSIDMYNDILELNQVSETVKHFVAKTNKKKSFYTTEDISRGLPLIENIIICYCLMKNFDDRTIISQIKWTQTEIVHWKVFFAKMLIQHA